MKRTKIIKLKDLLENKKVTPTKGEINSVTRLLDKAKSQYKKASTYSKGGTYDIDWGGDVFDKILPGKGSKYRSMYIVHDNKLNKTFAVGGVMGGGYGQRNSFETRIYAEIKNDTPVGGVKEFDADTGSVRPQTKPPLNFDWRLNVSGIEKESVTLLIRWTRGILSKVLYRYDESITKPGGKYREDILDMEKQIARAMNVYTNPALTGQVKVPEASTTQGKVVSFQQKRMANLPNLPAPGADSRAVAEWGLNTWNQYLAQLK